MEGGLRLLVVEDDAAIRDFLQGPLSEAGYQIDVAKNALDAEGKALEGVHDGFIIDLRLPTWMDWT